MKRATVMAIAVAMAAGGVRAQPVQWRVADGGNGHWYELAVVGPITWISAKAAAEARGGHLATLTSADEWAVARTVVAASGYGESPRRRWGSWLGGFQDRAARDYSEPLGGWRWVTGEPWGFTAWLTTPGYAGNLCAETLEEEDYLAFGGWFHQEGGRWNDLPLNSCDNDPVVSFVIEWSADCNNDGIVDKGQILSGQLPDTNHNGIPDSVVIATQPTDQNVEVDTPVAFVVEVGTDATCTVPVTYQWQRRNPLVADPAAPNAWIDLAGGNGLFGTRAPNLTLLRPVPALATGYRCKIGGGCGCEPNSGSFAFTNTVNFSVACPADFNADGGIDFGDIEAFFERWENGC